jgi:hypothetical protein
MAYKKLSQKNAFGKGLNIRVAWAEPLNDPDEKDMQVSLSLSLQHTAYVCHPLSFYRDHIICIWWFCDSNKTETANECQIR